MLNDGLYILVLLPFVAIVVYAYKSEKSTWNNGICKENGLPWNHFDTDSQGGRGYKAGDRMCWISWPYIDI